MHGPLNVKYSVDTNIEISCITFRFLTSLKLHYLCDVIRSFLYSVTLHQSEDKISVLLDGRSIMDGWRDGRYLEVWIALFSMLSCYGSDIMLENVESV
jgi:hypothetical protein